MCDWNHPSLKGSYLMACTIFSTVFQESSIGNTYYADLPEEDASYFQTVASNTVLDSLELWNITPTYISFSDFSQTSVNSNFKIFPNPASELINIELKNFANFQQIIITDITGKILLYQNDLESNTTIDISNFKADIYLVKLQNDNKTYIKKIIVK